MDGQSSVHSDGTLDLFSGVLPSPTERSASARVRARTRSAERAVERSTTLTTGVGALDELLDGGLPRGRVVEISGPASSGKTALALAVLARASHQGETVAVIDRSSSFGEETFVRAGIDLERLLHVSPAGAEGVVATALALLEAGAVVLLDEPLGEAHGATAVVRLLAAAARSGGELLVVSESSAVRGARRAGCAPMLRLIVRRSDGGRRALAEAQATVWLERSGRTPEPARVCLDGPTRLPRTA